jgi:hypothetical protein
MSPNGTLMAYSTPVDIKELRDQAALVSMAWKEQEAGRALQTSQHDAAEASQQPLETLTIETQFNNIIVRAIQRSLLLVLVGGVPPTRKKVFRITPEARGDARYPVSIVADDAPTSQPGESSTAAEGSPSGDGSAMASRRAPSILSNMSQREKDVKIGVLHIQRKKLDALTDFIRKDFETKGFVMPDDSTFP